MIARVIQGDCIERLREMADNSIDAIVTDPPYELGFMGKAWDSTGIANNVEIWAEALRVLKPGGHLAAFGGTRTYHRMTCAIEDAGFEIRDSLHWIYGTGFPKNLRVNADPRFCQCDASGRSAECKDPSLPQPARKGTAAGASGGDPRQPSAAHLTDTARGSQDGYPRADGSCGARPRPGASVARSFSPSRQCAPTHSRSPAPGGAQEAAAYGSPSPAQYTSRRASTGYLFPSDGATPDDGHTRASMSRGSLPGSASHTQDTSGVSSSMDDEGAQAYCQLCGKPVADGWGTALKPAHEPIVLARKPLTGTVAANVLEHGTGAINVDATRVATDGRPSIQSRSDPSINTFGDGLNGSRADGETTQGRWPPNLLLTHDPECGEQCVDGCAVREIGDQSGERSSGAMRANVPRANRDGYNGPMPGATGAATEADTGTAARFFPCFRYVAKPSTGEREAGLYDTELIDVEWTTWDKEDQKAVLRVDTARSRPKVIGVSGTGTKSASEWSTLLFGSSIEDACRQGCSCIIETSESSTTGSPTLLSLIRSLTSGSIPGVSCAPASGGSPAESVGEYRPRQSITVESPPGSRLGVSPAANAVRLRISASVVIGKRTAGELTDRADGSAGLESPRAGAGRTSGGRLNIHATVKPIALMQWLCRLLTPPGGTVLDPFCGSGTTGAAALREGFGFIGIELDETYAEIARSRIVGDAPLFNRVAR